MEKLTISTNGEIYYAKGKRHPLTPCEEMETWEIRMCMHRLAEYEETGLTHEEVKQLNDKQTPTKPIMISGHGLTFDEFLCPGCKALFDFDEQYNKPYCEDCGQALDWGNK